jgi:hypothetical protein
MLFLSVILSIRLFVVPVTAFPRTYIAMHICLRPCCPLVVFAMPGGGGPVNQQSEISVCFATCHSFTTHTDLAIWQEIDIRS